MVFPAEGGHFSEKGKGYIRTMRANGLDTLAYHGVNSDDIFVLVRASTELLQNYADDIDYRMLLDPTELKRIASEGNTERHIAPIEISHLPEVSAYDPYAYIYGRFSRRMPESLYYRDLGERSPFNNTLCCKLTNQLIEKKPPTGGQNLKIKRYLHISKTLRACFSLHCQKKKLELEAKWMKYPIIPWEQPYELITAYFGEKICLYFIFLGHYSWWLIVPSIVGVPLQIAVFAMDGYSSAPFLPFYSYFTALWGSMMLEYWKRTESEWAMKWGTLGYEDTETDRPDFRGQRIKSYIDGKDVVYFSSAKRNQYVMQSLLVVALLIAAVVGLVASIYVIRFAIQPYIGTNAQTVASVANSIQILIANAVYTFLATALTNRENHRTETQYEDSLISKIFLFQFVNSYASFFFLAFIAEFMGGCQVDNQGDDSAGGDCMFPLTLNLAIIFGSRLAVGNITELLLPYLGYKYRMKTMMKTLNGNLDVLTRPEAEFLLEEYDVQSSSIADYSELAIQFGYASMFVTAFPLAPLFSLVSNFVETTGDAWKLLHLHQRPMPFSAEDIGTWQTIFMIISIASVVTNASLTIFTMSVTDHFSEFMRFWLYIGFQWSCFTIQAVIMEAVPDIPEAVLIQNQRTDFLVEKVIDQVPDDEDSTLEDATAAPIDILVHPSKGNHRFASY
jgi:uncharacterized protein YoxC